MAFENIYPPPRAPQKKQQKRRMSDEKRGVLEVLVCLMREEAYVGMAWRACVYLFPPKDHEEILDNACFGASPQRRRHHNEFCIFDAMASSLDDAMSTSTSTTEKRWKYNCFMRYLVAKQTKITTTREADGTSTYEAMELMFRGCFQPTMLKAISHFQKRAEKPAKEKERPRYIFQYAKEGTKKQLCRRFVVFLSAWETMFFFSVWYGLQLRHRPLTMLLECGTCDEATPRKWILDIDAPLDDLRALVPNPDEEEGLVTEFAMEVSRDLHACRFLRRPCHFAITQRHSDRKRSWHITLCAFAPFPRWRAAILLLTSKRGKEEQQKGAWRLFRFVDESTVRNSKSQYMQVLGSGKVDSGGGVCFKKVGIFSGVDGRPVGPSSDDDALFFAASSMMLPDPWSITYDPQAGVPLSLLLVDHSQDKKRKRPFALVTQKEKQKTPSKKKEEEASGMMSDLYHTWPEEWMRRFAEAKDGTTRLTFIPSMAERKNWCPKVMDLVQNSGYEVTMYACVNNMSMCCRILKGEGRVHRHRTDANAMVFVCQPAKRRGAARMFVRCFSSKCKHVTSAWVEIQEADATSSRAVASMLLRPPEQKMMMMEPLLVAKEQLQQAVRLESSRRRIIAFIQQSSEDAWLLPSSSSSSKLQPPSAIQGRVVLCGRLPPGSSECPRKKKNDEKAEVHCCVIEQLEPSSGAYSYRLLVHCACALCATFVEPWVEEETPIAHRTA